MRSISWVLPGAIVAALGGSVLVCSPTGASARMAMGSTQTAMGYGYPARGYYYRYPARGYYYGSPIRPYYYRPVKPAPIVRPPGSCGQFRYWSKGRCLDARTTPPKLN